MPSTLPLPTVTQLRTAGAQAITGQVDPYAKVRTGDLYDHIGGPYAILMAREAAVDRDKFRAIYIDNATGDDLTRIVQARFGVMRILGTQGQGMSTWTRTSSAAGAGTLWAGTRIQVAGSPPSVYEVAQDTVIGASDLRATVPIQAAMAGTGVAVQNATSLTALDPVYDPLWIPINLTCADGTDYEQADAYRSRARTTRTAQRTGYIASMTAACQSVGAAYVLMFPSSYGIATDDFTHDDALNAIYVADASFQSPPGLVQACAVALEGVRVLGADLWVGGVTTQIITVAASVALVDDPGKLPLVPIQQLIVRALVGYFAGSGNGYVYKRAAMAGAIAPLSNAIQSVTFTSPSSDAVLPDLADGVVQGWPAVLTKYVLPAQNIALTFTGPQ